MYFHLSYRQTEEDVIKGLVYGKVPSIPYYSTISRRINRLDIKIEYKGNEFKGDYIVIAIYSKGVKFVKRDQWLR